MEWTNLNFLNVTEKAAIACASLRGKLNKNEADHQATEAMRNTLNSMSISAKVVIGEGEMDEAPMLFIGEQLGKGSSNIKLDIAVDPLDGTKITSKNQNNAITVIALTEEGGFLQAPDMYMKKIASGVKDCLDINKSLTENLNLYVQKTGKKPKNIVVCMLERSRHEKYVEEILAFGASVKLVSDGDILPGISTNIQDSEIDILYGIGAAPEGVITAAAVKCLGGDFQGILLPNNEQEIERMKSMGVSSTCLKLDDLVKGNNIVVSITAVTDSFIGKGVQFSESTGKTITNSLKITNKFPQIQYIQSIYTSDNFNDFL